MQEEIKNWLHTKDYASGVALYQQYGSSAVLKRMFGIGETAYNKQKLLEGLEGLLTAFASPIPKPVSPAPMASTAQQTPGNDWKPLYKASAHLHAQLSYLNRAERKAAAFQILDNMDQVEAIWQQEKQLREPETKTVLEEEQEPVTPLEIDTRIRNLRTQISKHKNKPEKAGLVKQWTQQKEELEEKLKQLKNGTQQ